MNSQTHLSSFSPNFRLFVKYFNLLKIICLSKVTIFIFFLSYLCSFCWFSFPMFRFFHFVKQFSIEFWIKVNLFYPKLNFSFQFANLYSIFLFWVKWVRLQWFQSIFWFDHFRFHFSPNSDSKSLTNNFTDFMDRFHWLLFLLSWVRKWRKEFVFWISSFPIESWSFLPNPLW